MESKEQTRKHFRGHTFRNNACPGHSFMASFALPSSLVPSSFAAAPPPTLSSSSPPSSSILLQMCTRASTACSASLSLAMSRKLLVGQASTIFPKACTASLSFLCAISPSTCTASARTAPSLWVRSLRSLAQMTGSPRFPILRTAARASRRMLTSPLSSSLTTRATTSSSPRFATLPRSRITVTCTANSSLSNTCSSRRLSIVPRTPIAHSPVALRSLTSMCSSDSRTSSSCSHAPCVCVLSTSLLHTATTASTAARRTPQLSSLRA
mmetsp:Transcript_59207/g.145336  ORF Transcript_59207/g.145336 Transcript_59207/m.145336 type:complete len:267 (+) Transcript_59207:379-1179(+)